MPPAWRNQRDPTGTDTPTFRAASAEVMPVAIRRQNCRCTAREGSGRPGGRLALSVWGPRDAVPLIARAQDCIARLLPAPKVPRPSVFRLGDAEALTALLADAGFGDVQITPHVFNCHFDCADAYWQAFLDLAGGAAEALARLPEATQAQLRAAVADDIEAHRSAKGFCFESTVLIASARR